jgi:hypothetical protein
VADQPLHACCANCVDFRNDPDFLEGAFQGLTSLSSARGSVRADDGICVRHDRYLSARAVCREFRAKSSCRPAASAPWFPTRPKPPA